MSSFALKSYQSLLIRMVAITGEGSRLVQLGLDKELVEDFSDFREEYLGAPENQVLAEAIKIYMADRLVAEPEVRRRYGAAREKRRGSKASVVKLVPNGK